MRSDVFLSKEAFAKRECFIKRRQERLIQVREQSKKMAAAVLERAKRETERQYQDTENRILSELREHYSKELAVVRQYYNKCVSDINQQHYVKQHAIDQKNKRAVKFTKIIPNNSSNMHQENKTQFQKEVISAKPNDFTGKNCLKSSPTKRKISNKFKERVPETVEILPENIVVDSDENSDHNNYVEQKNECYSTCSLNKKNTIRKDSTTFHNKENCDSKIYDNGRNGIANGRQKKHCCKHVKKLIHPNVDKKGSRNNIFGPDTEFYDTIEQRHMNEMYNRVVHDRIRILEQKEKILRKRVAPLPLPTSNTNTLDNLNRFSEYFLKIRDKDISFNSFQKNKLSDSDKNKDGAINEGDIDGIENDLTRVHLKKQLLVLELSNVETQTEKNSHVDDVSDKSKETRVITECPVLDKHEAGKPDPLPSTTKMNEKPATSRAWCPSPIPKESESSEGKPVNIIEPPVHKTVKPKKSRHCKRNHLNKNKNVVVTILNNEAKVSSGTDTSSSLVTQNFVKTQDSLESDLSAENCNSHKTVKVIVNVLSNAECKKSKCLSPDKLKNTAHIMDDKHLKKLQNWRKVFENEEKLTESSYFSPPETITRKEYVVPERVQMKETEKQNAELPHDIGYYVRKLLFMSADSVQNLNVSSCSTTMMSESEENIPVTKTRQRKIPLHLPLYQNSFDDTLDAFVHSKFVFSENNTVQIENEATSVPDESVDLSSSVYLRKYVSSVSNSSAPESDSLSITNGIHYQQSKPMEKEPKKMSPKIEHSDQGSSSSSTSTIEENENVVENLESEKIELPTIEELLRRGFISEPLINRISADGYETLEDDEFIKEMLKVNTQPLKISDEREEKSKCCAPPPTQILSNNFQNLKIGEVQTETESSDSKCVDVFFETSKEPVDKELPTSREKSRLLGWMDATVQRTLEASAINSTSSGDSSDPVRRLPKTLQEIAEDQSEFMTNSDTASSNRFSFSPIKVPDIHLNIPTIFKTQ